MDFYNGSNDPNRFGPLNHQRPSPGQQQTPSLQNLHSSDNLSQQLYASNLTKFFDFHKNQQQQQQQQYQQQQLFFNDQLNMIDPSRRMESQFLDQQNTQNGNLSVILSHECEYESEFGLLSALGLLGSQLQKQRLFNKFDSVGLSPSQAPPPQQQLNGSNGAPNSRLQSFFQQHQQQQHPPPNSASVDDELDFDPFQETQKGLAELLENELLQQQSQTNHSKWLDSRRTRLPPPGFSHMNSFGLGVPRPAAQASKILPFMNGGNGSGASQGPQSNWPHHQQTNMNFGFDQTGNLLPQQNHQNNKGGK